MNIAIMLGNNIATRRRQLGLAQKELAIRLDITQDAMSRMEKGSIAPKLSRLETIAQELQCSVSFLFHSPDAATQELAATMADILATLSQPGQIALMNLVADAARVMRQAK